MTNPKTKRSRTRDDSSLADLVAQLRERIQSEGIQEQPRDWNELAHSSPTADLWATAPTGTDLIKRLAEPIKLFFEATRPFILSGPAPLTLATRGAEMGHTPVPLGPSAKVAEWLLPAEDGAPAISIRIYRRESGKQVMLHCAVDKIPAEQIHIELRNRRDDGSDEVSLRGRLSDFVAEDIVVGSGSWMVRLEFPPVTPLPTREIVREIPLEIDVFPDEEIDED